MRFLFVIQGEGRGHLTQAISLAQILQAAGHEVVRAMVGLAENRPIPAFFAEQFPAPYSTLTTPELLYCPTTNRLMTGATVRRVETAAEMLAACTAALPADVAVCAAAVADWRVAEASAGKIKKGTGEPPILTLVPNPDILAALSAAGPGRPRTTNTTLGRAGRGGAGRDGTGRREAGRGSGRAGQALRWGIRVPYLFRFRS